jgi:hypothetical protein
LLHRSLAEEAVLQPHVGLDVVDAQKGFGFGLDVVDDDLFPPTRPDRLPRRVLGLQQLPRGS